MALGLVLIGTACADPAPNPPATPSGGAASQPAATPTSQPGSHPAAQPASMPAARPGPTPATLGLGEDGQIRTQPEDRCPVCAMMPHKNPKFASGVQLADGRTFYTCGTGCLLRAHLHPEVYLGAGPITRAVVPDYFTGRPLDADKAFWVAGSDVSGPMGPTPVPLSSEADADSFIRRHGGPHRFQLKDLDDDRFQQITGKPALKPR